MARDNALRYIHSVGPQRVHMSLYFAVITIDAIVMFGTNRMNHTDYCKLVSKRAGQGNY